MVKMQGDQGQNKTNSAENREKGEVQEMSEEGLTG